MFFKTETVENKAEDFTHPDNLESLMLIATEKDIAMKIKSNKEKIIDEIAESSAEMSTMLLL